MILKGISFFFFLFPICDVNNHIGISLKRGLAILNLKELVSKDWKCAKKKSSNVDWNYGIIWEWRYKWYRGNFFPVSAVRYFYRE